MLPRNSTRWLIGGPVAVVMLAGYVLWDISRPVSQGTPAQAHAVAQPKDEALPGAAHDFLQRVQASNENTTRHGVVPAKTEENLTSDDTSEATRREAIRRADMRTETLRRFHATQPRNAWAQEAEVELQRAVLPEGIAFNEVSCKADVCRILATGKDRHSVFDAVSNVQKERKTFSRQISESAGVATVEVFISPNDSDWPNPFAKEDG